MLYSPFRLVMVIFPCEGTETVASSKALPSSSVTKPFNVNVWAPKPDVAKISDKTAIILLMSVSFKTIIFQANKYE